VTSVSSTRPPARAASRLLDGFDHRLEVLRVPTSDLDDLSLTHALFQSGFIERGEHNRAAREDLELIVARSATGAL
jgi:hypothetical protein